MGAILLLCMGVAQATVTDSQMTANLLGMLLAAGAVCCTVTYQVLGGIEDTRRLSSMFRLNLDCLNPEPSWHSLAAAS